MTRRALLAIALAFLGACTSARPAAQPAGQASTPSPITPTATATAASSALPHVFVIVMENRAYAQAMAMPYISGLAAQYAVATNYRAITHPSLPNYLALTAGSTFGITDDGYHRLAPGGLGAQLSEHRIAWRAYMEGMTGGCLDGTDRYAVRHNPFAYFGGGCPANVVPLTARTLDADLAGTTPNFVWITPDACHDGHDCSDREADSYLAGQVPKILGSAAWQKDGLLLIVWDEDDGSAANQVALLVVAPNLSQHLTNKPHDHYSLLATVEDRFGLPRLGQAKSADPVNELFG
jgi:phosphatidylinositol-3-phosphatase